jgi:hypothetical protein
MKTAIHLGLMMMALCAVSQRSGLFGTDKDMTRW